MQRVYLTGLLGAQVVGVASLLVAGDSTGVRVSAALAADRFVTAVLAGKLAEERFDDATPRVTHQGQGAFLLDVIV